MDECLFYKDLLLVEQENTIRRISIFHFCPDPTVHTSMKDIRIRFYPLSRAFPNLYGFGGSDPRVSADRRPKRIKKYKD